jgi:type IV pilus assembly protein PilQ
MNARLSSLLVAGGVVLAGIQTGSLQAAPSVEAVAQKVTLLSTSMESTGAGVKIFLRVPGMVASPGVQVLSNPHRVVLDLPGVDRGAAVTRKDLAQLVHPLIQKARLAQFATDPKPVTRLVLDVKSGTQVVVGSSADGVQLLLTPGEGRVQARLDETMRPQMPLPSSAVAIASASPMVAGSPVSSPVVPAPVIKPLVPLPAIGNAFQSLPQLAVTTTLTAATPEAVQTPEPEKSHVLTSGRAGGRTLGDSLTSYSGSKITIDLQNTEIRDFLRILADTGKLNLVMDPDVQGNFGFKFTDTPWDQVLDVVLKNAGLGKEIQNGVLRVAKVEKLQKEAEERKRLDETKALAGELQTITRPLSYAKVSEAQKILKEMLTKRGSVILDDRTNTLIITDLPRNIGIIDDLLQTLDVQIQQVQIEARIVEANKNWQQQFGVKWPESNSGNASISSGSSSTSTPWVGTSAPFWNGIQGFNRSASGQQAAVGFAPGVDGSTSIAAPAGELWLSFISNRFSINAILQAMESDGTIKIVSSPKLVTQNNKKATILSGQKIPYPTQQGGAQGGAITVAFIDANLQLDVTPQITNEGTIIMDLKVEKAAADFTQTVQGTPTIDRKSIETQVLVRDGGTAVLGGVYITNSSTQSTGVPFLKNLPLIGFLFRNNTKQEQNIELLIFITPRILRQ